MKNSLLDFTEFENNDSKFTAQLQNRGGNITFSNSGKGGNRKHFNLSLETFLQCLKDIKNNITKFKGHENYVEREWRGLGSEFFSDGPANAQITVQTKPMFATLSKIIMWANNSDLNQNDPEKHINLELTSIENTIKALDELTDKFKPNNSIQKNDERILHSSSSIRDFALMVFKYLYNDSWNLVLKASIEKSATINEKEYIIYDHEWFKNLIGAFENIQNKESLSSANTLRYFEKPIFKDKDYYYYFTTQWNAKGEYNLSFDNLVNFIENNFPHLTVQKKDKTFIFKLKSNSLKIIQESDNKNDISQDDFSLEHFIEACKNSGLKYKPELIIRYISSLIAKPFVLLSGLSGSGKTKLAQVFAQWIAQDTSQYCIVPVGADWTNREPLLGYVNALTPTEYILPENGALELIINANDNPEKPYFLILDEMNLSHVERYFADFLSVMESDELFKLHSSDDALDGGNHIKIESQYNWPKNLFIVGTVNIDETTYMFSPKVLDRANVIEFRVSESEMSDYFINSKPLDLKKLNGEDGIPLGAKYGEDFVKIATHKTSDSSTQLKATLNSFFVSLQKVGAEFGYRTASEIQTLFGQIDKINPDFDKSENFDEQYPNKEHFKIDVAIMQKLLPKLHGSRNKLVPVLTALAIQCYDAKPKLERETHVFDKRGTLAESIIYPISLEKIERMYDNVIANGFTSYAEA